MKKTLSKAFMFVALSGFAVTSCYDDTLLWESVKDIQQQVGYIQNQLDSELEALKAIINKQVTIKSCISKEDGTYLVTFTDNTSITVYPKQEALKSVVTYTTINGVDYWAYYDENGDKHTLLDESNKLIPVKGSDPKIVTKDDKNYLVIGGKEYPLGGNSIFTGYEVHKNELTGEVYSVTFTFGEGLSYTITVDGVCSLSFVEGNFMMGYAPISQQYIALGTTSVISVQKIGVVDYILQLPAGWKVQEKEDENLGLTMLYVTAPTKAAVEAGLADKEGYMKAVSVFEGGKAGVSKIFLTSSAFETFRIDGGNLVLEPMPGVEKYAYGVCDQIGFDEDEIVEVVNPLFMKYDYPQGYGIGSGDLTVALADVYGKEITPGDPIVVWVAPAIYDEGDEDSDAYYYIQADDILSIKQGYSSYTFEVSDPTYNNATVNMILKGIEEYYCGVAPKTEDFVSILVSRINGGYYETVNEPYTFSGKASDFANDPELEILPESSYYAWLLIAEEGKIYEEEDIIIKEFKTKGIEAGGSVAVKVKNSESTPSSIKVSLEAEGADMIYYAWISASDISRYNTDEHKTAYLLEKGALERGSSVDITSDLSLKPNTDAYLIALAVDSKGKYGSVFTQKFTTSGIPFSETLKVSLKMVENNAGNFRVGISSTGAENVSYLYWVGKASSSFWMSKSSGLGGSAENAEVYMYTNPNDTRFITCMDNYPLVDGIVLMEDLSLAADYVFVALAINSEGEYSHAQVLKFTTRSMDLGDVVYAKNSDGTENAIWANARPTVEFLKDSFRPGEGMRSGAYSFNVTLPAGYTGYVLSGTDMYYAGGKGFSTLSVEAAIIETIEYADDRKDIDILVDDNLWQTMGYPSGWIIYCYMHGAPIRGAATIFADESVHKAECDCKETYKYSREETHPDSNGGVVILYNDGTPIKFSQPDAVYNASVPETHTMDKVFIVLRDKNDNYYQTYRYNVPVEYFAGASAD